MTSGRENLEMMVFFNTVRCRHAEGLQKREAPVPENMT